MDCSWVEMGNRSELGIFCTIFTSFCYFLANYWTDLEDISTVVLVIARATPKTQIYIHVESVSKEISTVLKFIKSKAFDPPNYQKAGISKHFHMYVNLCFLG